MLQVALWAISDDIHLIIKHFDNIREGCSRPSLPFTYLWPFLSVHIRFHTVIYPDLSSDVVIAPKDGFYCNVLILTSSCRKSL